MIRAAVLLAFLVYQQATPAQGDLSELFSIVRAAGRARSESQEKRVVEIYTVYANRQRSLDKEWPVLNEALADSDRFVRQQAAALLAAILFVKLAEPVALPDSTQDLLVKRFDDEDANVRENAVRILAIMKGGVPPSLGPRLLRMAQTESNWSARGIAISALASISPATPEVKEFWIQSLSDVQNTSLRGAVLNAFRFHAQTDTKIISLIIEALGDSDRFVRQEAIAAIMQIGKPAAAALPRLIEMRDQNRDLRGNIDAAIRVLQN
jgi:HEAT repeat protein